MTISSYCTNTTILRQYLKAQRSLSYLPSTGYIYSTVVLHSASTSTLLHLTLRTLERLIRIRKTTQSVRCETDSRISCICACGGGAKSDRIELQNRASTSLCRYLTMCTRRFDLLITILQTCREQRLSLPYSQLFFDRLLSLVFILVLLNLPSVHHVLVVQIYCMMHDA